LQEVLRRFQADVMKPRGRFVRLSKVTHR
jgi:hypothetical protein